MIAMLLAASPPMLPGLAAALARDDQVIACANDAKARALDWVPGAFELRQVTLRSGEAMTVAIATDPCLAVGPSVRIMIFQRTSHGYRRVLNNAALPDFVDVTRNGLAVLPIRESADTIFEAAYVWNGTSYAYSAQRSHLYDVTLGRRRPYLIPIRFSPSGGEATTIWGHAALNFGQSYFFDARAGQQMTIAVAQFDGRQPAIFLYEGETKLREIDALSWIGRLPHTAAYTLTVLPYGETDPTAVSTYSIRLSLH